MKEFHFAPEGAAYQNGILSITKGELIKEEGNPAQEQIHGLTPPTGQIAVVIKLTPDAPFNAQDIQDKISLPTVVINNKTLAMVGGETGVLPTFLSSLAHENLISFQDHTAALSALDNRKYIPPHTK